jgi:hypothetical protein
MRFIAFSNKLREGRPDTISVADVDLVQLVGGVLYKLAKVSTRFATILAYAAGHTRA